MSEKSRPSQSQYFAELAKEYDLFASCGSDFHGLANTQRVRIGILRDLPDNENLFGQMAKIVKNIH